MMNFEEMSYKERCEYVKNTNKKIYLTIGLRYRHPGTLDKLVSKERALDEMEHCCHTDIDKETEDGLYISVYSGADMW